MTLAESTPTVTLPTSSVRRSVAFTTPYGRTPASTRSRCPRRKPSTPLSTAVWITYSFDLPQDQKEKLRQIVESQDCLLASPYPYLQAPVVASAWGKQLELEGVDDPNLQEFIRFY